MIKLWNPSKAFSRTNNDTIVLVKSRSGRYMPYVNAETVFNGLGVRLDAQLPLAQDIMDMKIQLSEYLGSSDGTEV